MVKRPRVAAWEGFVYLLFVLLFGAAGSAQPPPSKPKPATPKTGSSSADHQEPKPASGRSAAQAPAKEAATKQAPQDAAPADIDPSHYAGSQACADCHEAAGNSFPTNPHRKTLENKRPDRQGCEACHGAGKAHAESGDPDNIIRFESVSKAGTAKICGACHDLSPVKSSSLHASHGKADVGCLECHSIHSAKAGTTLLKSENAKLCSTCHENRQQ
jgi:predicted CXXCH cytochrome family protein